MEDLDKLISIWHKSIEKAFPYIEIIQSYTLNNDRNFLKSVILENYQVWIGEENIDNWSGRIYRFKSGRSAVALAPRIYHRQNLEKPYASLTERTFVI